MHPKGNISRMDEYCNTVKICSERYDREEENAKETTRNSQQMNKNDQTERRKGSLEVWTTGLHRSEEHGCVAAHVSMHSKVDKKTSKTSA